MTRGQHARRLESRLGRRSPKRHPSKHLNGMVFIDYPFAGPSYGRSLREFVKVARRREAREAWRVEGVNHG
jgi:hypothetical protein